MRSVSVKRLILVATFTTGLTWAQAVGPTIRSLDSSLPGNSPGGVTAITSGSPIPQFVLYINGTFLVNASNVVTWLDTSTGTTTRLTPNGVSAVQVTVLVPASLFATLVAKPVPVTITVVQNGQLSSNSATFAINPPLTSGSPNLPPGTVGQPYQTPLVSFGTGPYQVGRIVNGALPAGLNLQAVATGIAFSGTPTAPGVFNFQPVITDFWTNTIQPRFTITILLPLGLATTSLASGTTGTSYTAALLGQGGIPPYTWAATGLPPGLGISPQTGVISGVPLRAGAFNVNVTLKDSNGATVTAQLPLVIALPPVSFSTTGLPNGTVGVPYVGTIGATGGTGNYAFSLNGGTVPDGLSLSPGGSIAGTPKAPGVFPFAVLVNDGAGVTAARDFSITVLPAPLNITGGSPATGTAGTPINITFGGTGGVAPYRFTATVTLPPGTAFVNGVLSGTPTTAGTYTFRVIITDSTNATFTKDFTVVITPAGLSLTGAVGNGQVGVAYSGQLTAAGGIPGYTYAVSGLPAGLGASASGAITGTPTTEGEYSINATVTDSTGAKANATFPITIAPASLTVTTASLPDGLVNISYAASLNATGGVKPYTWSVSGLPDGLSATAAGVIGGTPTAAGKFTVGVTVKDSAGVSALQRFNVTIASAAISITNTTLDNGTAGTAYSALLSATGGVPPFTWSATGLPAGLTISAGGTISGIPGAPGTFPITATVKDSTGTSGSKTIPLIVGLPAAPPLNFSGITDISSPLQQPRLQVSLANAYPVDVVVTLTLTFAPDNGADDPAILFATGGRTTRITIPAGSTTGATDAGVQTGSVAGLITIAGQLQALAQDVTPTPAPRRTIRIAALAPVPVTVTAARNSTGFTVTIVGYVTDREITQALFTFNAAPGSNLQTTSLTIPLDTLFAQYFGGSQAAPFGSQFAFTQPFTVNGSAQAIASVMVTMVNKIGQSTAVTATLN